MLTFTADGSKLLVANEGYAHHLRRAIDPGRQRQSIIDMGSRSVIDTVSFAGRSHFAGSGTSAANTGMDYEPEYITVNAAGTQAFVTLQEANAHGRAGSERRSSSPAWSAWAPRTSRCRATQIDPSHKDGTDSNCARPMSRACISPTRMAAYDVGGQTYLVMANEGDTREDDGDKARVQGRRGLDAAPADLKQLNISTADSTIGRPV